MVSILLSTDGKSLTERCWLFVAPWPVTALRCNSATITLVLTMSSVWGGGGGVSESRKNPAERTLKIWRIPLRFTFQTPIVSLSFFAWTVRENIFRLPFSVILAWISSTVLR